MDLGGIEPSLQTQMHAKREMETADGAVGGAGGKQAAPVFRWCLHAARPCAVSVYNGGKSSTAKRRATFPLYDI